MIGKSIVITTTTLLLLASCSGKNEQPDKQTQAIPEVITDKVKLLSYAPTQMFTGTVLANREANLGAALPGKVEAIHFIEGDFVNKGDLIVELSDEMLTQAEVENQALQKDYERVKRLREKESISQMEYDHIKAKLDASNAKTEMIRKNTRVYAPFSGTIVERMMEEGEIFFINPGLDPGYSMRSGIVRLMQLNPVRVKFDVNEKDLPNIMKGLDALIELDAVPDKSIKAKVSSVKPMLSTLTRTASAEIVLDNSNGLLMPGMFARVTVMLPEQQLCFVPLNAISHLPGTGEEFVYIVDNDVAERIVVRRLYTNGNLVAVDGLEPNQSIVVEGKGKLQHGQKVNVRQ